MDFIRHNILVIIFEKTKNRTIVFASQAVKTIIL